MRVHTVSSDLVVDVPGCEVVCGVSWLQPCETVSLGCWAYTI
jgi:hypothetical protein